MPARVFGFPTTCLRLDANRRGQSRWRAKPSARRGPRANAMPLTKPVVVPFEGPLTKGNFVRRTDRFTAHLVLDGIEVSDESNGEVKAHCINPGRMEAFVDPGATIWARRAPENGPKRKTDWTWELIERDGVICSTRVENKFRTPPRGGSLVDLHAGSTNTQRPNALIAAVLKAALIRLTDYKSVKGRSTCCRTRVQVPNLRYDFFVEEKDGTHRYVEVKNCHATYPDEVVAGLGLLPRLGVGAGRAALSGARRFSIKTEDEVHRDHRRVPGGRHEGHTTVGLPRPRFLRRGSRRAKGGRRLPGLRASHTTAATTIEDEMRRPVDCIK